MCVRERDKARNYRRFWENNFFFSRSIKSARCGPEVELCRRAINGAHSLFYESKGSPSLLSFSFSCLGDTNSSLFSLSCGCVARVRPIRKSYQLSSREFSLRGQIYRLNVTSLVCINGRRLERRLTSALGIIFYSRVTITGAVTCRKHEGRNSQHARWLALARDAIRAGLHAYMHTFERVIGRLGSWHIGVHLISASIIKVA